MRQRIGVYGGTFDPIHNGHLRVAEAVIKAFALERMLLVPAFIPPHKRAQQISSPHHRLAMLALATNDEPHIFISTIELEAPARPYTIDTLQSLQETFGNSQLFFVMGADSFIEITLWYQYQRLLSEFDIIVASRPGRLPARLDDAITGGHLPVHLRSRIVNLLGGFQPVAEHFDEPRIYLTDYVAMDVSSTDIRRDAAAGKDLDEMVPESVAIYIRKYKLYQ